MSGIDSLSIWKRFSARWPRMAGWWGRRARQVPGWLMGSRGVEMNRAARSHGQWPAEMLPEDHWAKLVSHAEVTFRLQQQTSELHHRAERIVGALDYEVARLVADVGHLLPDHLAASFRNRLQQCGGGLQPVGAIAA